MADPKENAYQIVVDKDIVYEAMVCDNKVFTLKHYNELKKVFKIVVYRHFGCFDNGTLEEFLSMALERVICAKSYYNPMFDAYTFVYTSIRNTIGNYLKNKKNTNTECVGYADNIEEDEKTYVSPMELKYSEKMVDGWEVIKIDDCDILTFMALQCSRKHKCHINDDKNVNADELLYIFNKVLKSI